MATESKVTTWPIINPILGDEILAAEDVNGDIGQVNPSNLAAYIIKQFRTFYPYNWVQIPALFSTNVEANNNNNPTNWVDVFTLTVPAADTINGEYELFLNWVWESTSANRAAYWRAVINGTPTDYLRITSNDTSDVNVQLVKFIQEFTAGQEVTVLLQCVLENGGGQSTVTIQEKSASITLEAKQNYDI
jgi:hypothetical protein